MCTDRIKRAKLEGVAFLPGKFFDFRPSEIAFGAILG